jgi:hypothetical protein
MTIDYFTTMYKILSVLIPNLTNLLSAKKSLEI